MANEKQYNSPKDSKRKLTKKQNSSPDIKNRASASNATKKDIAKPDTSTSNQLGDRKEKMAASNTKPEQSEAKQANKTTESTPTPPPVQKSGSGFASTLATFAFLLSVAAGGGIYWMWEQMNLEKQDSASAISSLEQQLKSELAKSQQSIRSEVSQSQESIKGEVGQVQQTLSAELASKSQAIESLAQQIESETTSKITAAESNLTDAQAKLGEANRSIKETQERQASLETSLEAVYARIGNTSREWVIAEADYLLKIANHRLQLEQDVTTSIQALALADKRINSLSDPALNEVRNVIAQELTALQTLPIPDQAGIAMQLSEMQNNVDQLPLAARTQPTHQETTEFQANDAMTVDSWSALPIAILEVLKGMVSVNYNDKPIEPLLSPEQVKHLHENLKLKLEQARIVSLRGDEKLYGENLDLAIAWTTKHFNTEEVATKKFVDNLNYLKSKQIALKTPDISTSLRTLRRVAKRLELGIPELDNNASNSSEMPSANVAMN